MGNLTVKESGEMVNIISPNVNNITSFKVYFSPKQEGTGDPSPENVREIVGWNGVEGYGCGKNLFGGEAFESAVHSSVIFEDAQYGKYLRTYNITSGNSIFTMPFKENTQYTFIGKIRRESTSSITGLRIKYTDGSTTHLFADTSSEANEIVTVRTVSAKNKTIDGLYYLQRTVGCHIFFNYFGIFEGDVSIDDFEPYQGATISTDWTEDVGTIYGGYVDLISGELVQEYASIVLTGAEEGWQFYGTEIEGGHIFSNSQLTNHIGGTQRPTEEFCTHFPMSRNWKTILNTCIVGESGLIGFTVDNSIAETVEEFTQFLAEQYTNGTPVRLVYKIYVSYYASYTIHQLTPQQLSTLKGQNNFWSNADYVEIEYELTETFDIQKAKRKIILNQPHVESASGDIVTFDTDIRGKLKECKVYFSPVQEGEGDPSPDNVRNIVGWNGVEGYSCGKNLFNMETAVEGYIDTTGKKISSPDQENMTSDFIPVIEGETYTWAHYPTRTDVNYWTGYAFYSSKDMDSVIGKRTVKNTLKPIYITVPADAKYIRIGSRYLNGGEAQLEKGSIENVSYEPYQATTTSIDWTDDVGTIYGGYVDLVSGELVEEWHSFLINSNTEVGIFPWGGIKTDSATGIEYATALFRRYGQDPKARNIKENICDKLPYSTNQSKINTVYMYDGDSYGGAISLPTSEIGTTTESLSQYLADKSFTIVYKLRTPIHYQLTPQQILTFKGINNVYSNTNGQTEIKYWKH